MSNTTIKPEIEFTDYTACAFAEGFCEGEGATTRQRIEAFSYIFKRGMHRTLQGFYGRSIQSLIDAGVLEENGDVNYDHEIFDDCEF
jgi:hypothetical protein